MYWDVRQYLSVLCAKASFRDKVIDEIAAYIAETSPQIKGFNRRGLYRMKQFYKTYKDNEFVTPLVTQISWTNHLLIMSGLKSAEERHFYMELCAKNHYSTQDLERQMDRTYYDRYMMSAKKPLLETVPQNVRGSILDSYVLEFLDLPEQYSEHNLKKAILENLKQFILEFGKDFSFIGEEYRVQVGGQDFYIDRRTHTCHPSYNTIAAATGMSRNTAIKSISALLEMGLITVEASSYFDKHGMKWKGNNLYTILPVSVAVEEFHRRQLRQLELDANRRRAHRRQEEYSRRRPRTALCAPVSAQAASAPF